MDNVYNAKGTGKFTKGNPGKPKGAISPKTKAWEELGAFIVQEGAERYMQSLKALEDDKFVERFEHVLEYFKPKLARTEHTDKDGKDLPTPIINVSANFSNRQDSSPQEED